MLFNLCCHDNPHIVMAIWLAIIYLPFSITQTQAKMADALCKTLRANYRSVGVNEMSKNLLISLVFEQWFQLLTMT